MRRLQSAIHVEGTDPSAAHPTDFARTVVVSQFADEALRVSALAFRAHRAGRRREADRWDTTRHILCWMASLFGAQGGLVEPPSQ